VRRLTLLVTAGIAAVTPLVLAQSTGPSVVDAKDGAVLGHIDLGGTPEQTIGDGRGTIYQVLQDRPGAVAVIDAKTMKVTKTYPFGDNGGCNGLALDAKNQILFAA
jgi:DNA-binding beta-propeller fold protein YncE